MKGFFVPFAPFLLICASMSYADTCPLPSTAVEPSVSASVSFNKKTGKYTYSYTLINGKLSQLSLERFSMFANQSPSNIKSPFSWSGKFIEIPGAVPSNVGWAADPQRADIEGIDMTMPNPQLLSLKSAIRPGSKLSGFSFESTRPPGIAQFFAEGRTQVPVTTPTAADDEPEPNCPGWDFDSPRFETLVTGITVGPTEPNVESVKIRLRDESGANECKPINPKQAFGRLSVLVLSSKSFDVRDIDISSLRFGPAGAQPLSSVLTSGRDKDFESREPEEWEKAREDLEKKSENDLKRPNLTLVFDQASLGVQCVLDRALFLRGSTKVGGKIVGGVSSRTVGCDVRYPGHRRHRKEK